MESIFDTMPGIEMPIEQLKIVLSEMWQSFQDNKQEGQSASRASQMNLILHNGVDAQPEEAVTHFYEAIEFGQKHPCQLIVLCPEMNNHKDFIKAKLFSQCYLDKNLRKNCCCEAIILGYSINNAKYLKNVVSLWTENDLPIYYWINQVDADALNNYYMPVIETCKKVIYDAKVEPIENFSQIQWPQHTKLADLALLRLLPVRQSLGQFLSAFPPLSIIDGLIEVEIHYQEEFKGRGTRFTNWLKECLKGCFTQSNKEMQIAFKENLIQDNNTSIGTHWTYNNNKKLIWTLNSTGESAEIECQFEGTPIYQNFQLKSMSTAESLAGAIFY